MTGKSPQPIPAATLIVLSMLTGIGGLVTGIYLPAMPLMTEDFGTDATGIQFTFTAYLAGFAVGQLIFGPISDRFGRRGPLLTGAAVCAIASLAVAAAPTLELMVIARLAQAFGAAAGVVIARAVVTDSAAGIALVRAMNIMIGIAMFAPVISPLAGSVLMNLGSWHATLWAVIPITVVNLLGIILFVPDTLPSHLRRPHVDVVDLLRVVAVPRYALFLAISVAATAALMSYTAASSFIYQSVLGMDALSYSILYALNACGMVSFTMLSVGLARWGVPAHRTLGAGVAVLAVSAAALFLVPQVIFPVILFLLTANHGLITANASALALAEVRSRAGAGSAVLGFAQFGGASVAASFVGVAGALETGPYVTVVAVTAAIATVSYLAVRVR